MMRCIISVKGKWKILFSSTIHDIGWCSDVSNIYFMLVAGKKKCRSLTEQPIPEWVGWVSFRFLFAYRWQACNYGTWRPFSKRRSLFKSSIGLLFQFLVMYNFLSLSFTTNILCRSLMIWVTHSKTWAKNIELGCHFALGLVFLLESAKNALSKDMRRNWRE